MDRELFQQALRHYLSDLPGYEIEKSVSYFDEMIDDRIEEGMTEKEAVADIGDPRTIAQKILAEEQSFMDQFKTKLLPQNGWTTKHIFWAIVGSPLWLILLCLGVTLLITVPALVFSLWCMAIGFSISGIGSIIASPFLMDGNAALLCYYLCCGFIFLGIGLLLLAAAKASTQWIKPYYRKLIIKSKEKLA
ncbi:HAAS signaling domain-containing protein [Streptococcus dentiloxodontae]